MFFFESILIVIYIVVVFYVIEVICMRLYYISLDQIRIKKFFYL